MTALLYISFYLLLQRIEFRCAEKFAQAHIQTVADFLDGRDFRILAPAIDDIVQRRLRHAAGSAQFVERHMMLLTQLQDAVCYRLTNCHTDHPILFNGFILQVLPAHSLPMRGLFAQNVMKHSPLYTIELKNAGLNKLFHDSPSFCSTLPTNSRPRRI